MNSNIDEAIADLLAEADLKEDNMSPKKLSVCIMHLPNTELTPQICHLLRSNL